MKWIVYLACFVFIGAAPIKALDPTLAEIAKTFRDFHKDTNLLVSDELFLYDFRQTLPCFNQSTFNISVSNVSMRDYRKKSSITYDDLVISCLYGKRVELALPSSSDNAIEFHGHIKATYPFAETESTFMVTYDGVKFHLKADREDNLSETMRYENTNERLDIPLHIQIRNAEFKRQILEPMIYDKFHEWIDGNAPLHSIVSRCFTYRDLYPSECYQTKFDNMKISICGLTNFRRVLIANDGSAMKMELYTYPLNGTITSIRDLDVVANTTIRCTGLRVFTHVSTSHTDSSTASKLKMRVTLKDFGVTNTLEIQQSVSFDEISIRAIKNHIQDSIKKLLMNNLL